MRVKGIIKNSEDVKKAYQLVFKNIEPNVRIIIGELIDEAMKWQERLDECNNDTRPESKRINERAAQAQANVNLCRSIATELRRGI